MLNAAAKSIGQGQTAQADLGRNFLLFVSILNLKRLLEKGEMPITSISPFSSNALKSLLTEERTLKSQYLGIAISWNLSFSQALAIGS